MRWKIHGPVMKYSEFHRVFVFEFRKEKDFASCYHAIYLVQQVTKFLFWNTLSAKKKSDLKKVGLNVSRTKKSRSE